MGLNGKTNKEEFQLTGFGVFHGEKKPAIKKTIYEL